MSTPKAAFDGRVAIVTGGASGIGRAIVDRLVSQGASVAVWDIDEGKLAACAAEHGDRVLAAAIDVTAEDAVERGVEAAVARFGKLDILVNSAGIIGPNGPFWECSAAEWRRVQAINLDAVFLVSKAAAPRLVENGYGRIVTIASISGKEGNPNLAAYSASKAGVIGLTKSMGKDLLGTDVLVNAVAPAAIRSDLLDQMPEDYVKGLLAKIPMGRFGTVDEVAALVCWLASEECSFSTGAVYDISGGRATY